MQKLNLFAILTFYIASAAILWDGRLNNYSDASFLADWSWSNQDGPYQYYIHGSSPLKDYISLAKDFKNPADSSSKQGLQISIDDTSSWNGQDMMRTELIPSTDEPINKGKVFYHFSLSPVKEHPPSPEVEHQLAFFESHFTEMKFGVSGAEKQLQWFADSESHWNVTMEAAVWHNIAYEIDFGEGSVTFWHSTGADALKVKAGPVDVKAESNGQDFHVGVLRLPGGKGKESWMYSGVYIEEGELTKTIGGAEEAAPKKTKGNEKRGTLTISAFLPKNTTTAMPNTAANSYVTGTGPTASRGSGGFPAPFFLSSAPATGHSKTSTQAPLVQLR